MTQHTPGPWKLEAGRSFVTQSGTFYLSYGRDPDSNAANFPNFCELDRNAVLISAAPDLLAALESVIAYEDDAPPPDSYGAEVYAAARAAIVKARGGA